jgi:hypothetical protein
MAKTKRKKSPRFEFLEDRRVPATWGIPWADAQHLTASFVPDGTSLPDQQTSHLSQTLDSQLGAGKWEATILKALQTWAVNSNINVGLVAAGGQPVGVAGAAQGDARFGDIRIGAEPLPPDVVAITSPYNAADGTLSGDMILNSSYNFNPAVPGSYDLFTVALHEAGHVFGFADSTDPSSFMYDVYQGPKTGLAPGAIPALQALYGGPRAIDAIDHNPVSTNPKSPVSIPSPTLTSPSATLAGDLASAQEVDQFTFKAPSLLAAPLGVDVQVITSGLSLLAPKLTIYGPLGNVVATATASGPLDGEVSAHVLLTLLGGNYTVRVQGATGDAFSVGSYEITVGATLSLSILSSPTAGSHPIPEPSPYNGSKPLTVSSQIGRHDQVDVYSLKAPGALLDEMTINLQDWGIGLVSPRVTVYDGLGLVVGSGVASNPANPTVNIHVGLILPNATYYVRVENGTVNQLGFGTYQLAVSFAATPPSSNFTLASPWYGAPGVAQANGTFAAAATLQTPQGDAPQSHYVALDGIDAAQPQRFYKLSSPAATNHPSEVMTISVQTLSAGGLLPWIGVFDQSGNPMNAQVLTEQDGIAVVQVAISTTSTPYVLEVSSAQVGGTPAQGNYFMNVTFGANLALIGPISSGTLAAAPAGSSTAQVSTTLSIDQGELYSFVLAGSASNAPSDAILQMTLVDSSGNVVATLSTPASRAESLIVCLPAGNYTILIGATSPSGRPIPTLGYTLSGTNLTDPIKVYTTSGSGGTTTGK